MSSREMRPAPCAARRESPWLIFFEAVEEFEEEDPEEEEEPLPDPRLLRCAFFVGEREERPCEANFFEDLAELQGEWLAGDLGSGAGQADLALSLSLRCSRHADLAASVGLCP